MSQKTINELTDRVSALTADVSRLQARELELGDRAQEVIERAEHRMYDAMRERDAAQVAGREVIQTAKGLLGENKRLTAEVAALSEELEQMIWTHDDDMDTRKSHARVEEIKIEARNNVS